MAASDEKIDLVPETEEPVQPDGWIAADVELKQRLTADEQRLTADEQRLSRDERRLTQDEVRLGGDEQWIERTWRLEIVLAVLLALTIAALITSLIALNRNIDAVATAEPKNNSVGPAALQAAAVTDTKLADGAVTRAKIAAGAVASTALAPGSVGTKKIADAAVTGPKVAQNSLTGANIDETTLGLVPSASHAATADQAGNASALAGVTAASYLSGKTVVQVATTTTLHQSKGPITATCPAGTSIVAGGASIDGATSGIAITTSTPNGDTAWVAEAAALDKPDAPWRIVVTAICARGG